MPLPRRVTRSPVWFHVVGVTAFVVILAALAPTHQPASWVFGCERARGFRLARGQTVTSAINSLRRGRRALPCSAPLADAFRSPRTSAPPPVHY